ncbi:MAG: dinitrogenase iron-molybdenum cofactor biosynthesis protein [Bacteroidales bacterium]|nr:dinitrogenase iron-molybdenum cofactor biosynthesis protein [Bacteroidales bacterium]
MKIAIPTRGNQVDNHFGHCEAFTVYEINENQIISTEIVPSLQGCGCKSNIANVLQNKGVNVMLAGNMGSGAVNVLNNHGIKIFRGCSGDVKQLIDKYLNGQIGDSGETCNHHNHHHGHEGHQCNH